MFLVKFVVLLHIVLLYPGSFPLSYLRQSYNVIVLVRASGSVGSGCVDAIRFSFPAPVPVYPVIAVPSGFLFSVAIPCPFVVPVPINLYSVMIISPLIIFFDCDVFEELWCFTGYHETNIIRVIWRIDGAYSSIICTERNSIAIIGYC